MNWIRYSGVWVTLIVNPLHWRFRSYMAKPDDLNPKMWKLDAQLLFINLRVVIDDGSW